MVALIYIMIYDERKEVNQMATLNTAHPFITGRSQAVRIPKEYRFADDEELVINRIGDSLIITPKRCIANVFYSGVSLLEDDFMVDGRPNENPTKRAALD